MPPPNTGLVKTKTHHKYASKAFFSYNSLCYGKCGQKTKYCERALKCCLICRILVHFTPCYTYPNIEKGPPLITLVYLHPVTRIQTLLWTEYFPCNASFLWNQQFVINLNIFCLLSAANLSLKLLQYILVWGGFLCACIVGYLMGECARFRNISSASMIVAAIGCRRFCEEIVIITGEVMSGAWRVSLGLIFAKERLRYQHIPYKK